MAYKPVIPVGIPFYYQNILCKDMVGKSLLCPVPKWLALFGSIYFGKPNFNLMFITGKKGKPHKVMKD